MTKSLREISSMRLWTAQGYPPLLVAAAAVAAAVVGESYVRALWCRCLHRDAAGHVGNVALPKELTKATFVIFTLGVDAGSTRSPPILYSEYGAGLSSGVFS
jgi:hypothetical protein